MRVRQLATADHRVHAFGDHVDQPVVEVQVQFDVRVARGKLREDRQQHPIADGRQADPQPAPGLVADPRQFGLGLLDFGDNALAALIEQRAFIGQADAPGAAVQQAHAKALLQARQGLAHRRGRQPQALAGAHQATACLLYTSPSPRD